MHKYIITFLAFLPSIAQAQTPRNFADLVGLFLTIINDALIPAIFALTFLVIVWGVVSTWILNPGDETAREKGKSLVISGVIALVVMSGIWGILNILGTIFL